MNKKGSAVSIIWKITLFLIAFTIVVFAYIGLREWSGSFTMYFLRTSKWGELLLITLIVTAASIILTKLLQWQVRIEAKPAKRRRTR